MTRPLGCYECNGQPSIRYDFEWSAVCEECYDGAPDSGNRNNVGNGPTREEAIVSWNEVMLDLRDQTEMTVRMDMTPHEAIVAVEALGLAIDHRDLDSKNRDTTFKVRQRMKDSVPRDSRPGTWA